ncbi:DUF6049 family protein [Ornithinimicrobium cavernae]|uniref:DUF6049 family protein n=1 Tax=Ornithinimicrobium cavernae TaxID=2666047 RepID=UPI000D6957E5|nr:DUF6049 family protein [Ornithinimicrobium cavernae]
MSHHRPAPSLRGLVALLLTYAVLQAAVLIAPLTWVTSAAVAAEDALVEVRLDVVSPAIAAPDTTIRLSGTLSNTGADPVPVHSVRVSTAYRGLDTREAVQEWAEVGLGETPIGLAEDHVGVALAPGSTVRWFVDVPPDALAPGFEFATLPLRVEVLAQDAAQEGPDAGGADSGDEGSAVTDPGESGAVAGAALPGSELRTFLPWRDADDAAFNPVRIAWLAPLTLPGGPDLVDPDDRTRADAWAEAIGPGSRNLELLEGLAGTDATFVVDPALLEPLDPVASLTEAVVLPGEEAPPTETEPEPTDPGVTPPAPSQPSPSPPVTPPTSSASAPDAPGAGATAGSDADSGDGAATDPSGPGTTGPSGPGTTGPDGSGATRSPGSTATTGPPDDSEEPTQAPEPVVPPTPPTTASAVEALTQQIRELPEGQLWWLPVGDTDAAALLGLGAGVGEIAALVGRDTAEGLVAPGRTDVAWPVARTFSDDLIESLRAVWSAAGGATGAAGDGNGSLGAAVVPSQVMEDVALTGNAVRPHASGPQLIGYDERLSAVVAASGAEDRDGRAVQRFLAETLAVYQERPATDRSIVIAIPRTAQVDAPTLQALTAAAGRAPWLESSTASELLTAASTSETTTVESPGEEGPRATDDGPGSAVPGDLTAYPEPGESPLTMTRVRRTELTREEVVGVSAIVPGTEEARDTWLRVLDRQYSTSWRTAEGWEKPVEDAEALAGEILNGLSINPTTINLFADEGLMQITVVNELPLPIEGLRMSVDPGNGRLRVLGQPDPITIGPESRATVQFRARAVAAGQVPLHTSLSTPNGTQVGTAEETVVRVQPTGVWIYWLLGGVAGVILVLGLVRALRPAGGRTSPGGTGQDGAGQTTHEQNVAPPGPDLESP